MTQQGGAQHSEFTCFFGCLFGCFFVCIPRISSSGAAMLLDLAVQDQEGNKYSQTSAEGRVSSIPTGFEARLPRCRNSNSCVGMCFFQFFPLHFCQFALPAATFGLGGEGGSCWMAREPTRTLPRTHALRGSWKEPWSKLFSIASKETVWGKQSTPNQDQNPEPWIALAQIPNRFT